MRRDVRTIQRVAAESPKLRRVPTVTAEQRLRQTDQARLLRYQRDVAVVTWNVNHVRLRRANRAQLPFKVRIFLCIRLLADDSPAEFREADAEVLSQSAAVRRVEVIKNRGLLRLQRVGGEAGHHVTLKRVDEARAKNVIAGFRDCRIG